MENSTKPNLSTPTTSPCPLQEGQESQYPNNTSACPPKYIRPPGRRQFPRAPSNSSSRHDVDIKVHNDLWSCPAGSRVSRSASQAGRASL